MTFLKTKHERRSLLLTLLIGIGILMLLFLVGLKYMDPPIERGIAIAFGTTQAGDGQALPELTQEPITEMDPVSVAPNEVVPQVQEVSTQDLSDTPVIDSEPDTTDLQEAEQEQVKELPKEQVEPTPPKPDEATSDALARILAGRNSQESNDTGVGSNTVSGQEGDPEGNPDKSSLYGSGLGLDGDGNYLLGGRSVLYKQIYVQDCNEAGRVVVSIEVNRQGQVVRAQAGVRGTTNNSKCLLVPAKRAALETQFNPDPDAPAMQIGKIIYNFQLSE